MVRRVKSILYPAAGNEKLADFFRRKRRMKTECNICAMKKDCRQASAGSLFININHHTISKSI